jgi:hypothetical protein
MGYSISVPAGASLKSLRVSFWVSVTDSSKVTESIFLRDGQQFKSHLRVSFWISVTDNISKVTESIFLDKATVFCAYQVDLVMFKGNISTIELVSCPAYR